MEQDELLYRLANASGCFEMYEVIQSFQGFREGKDGITHVVNIALLDAGPTAQAGMRYHLRAIDAIGRIATGNPDDAIDTLIDTVHWEDLDKAP